MTIPVWVFARLCGVDADLHEDARDVARQEMKTKAFARSRDRGSASRCALRT
jgi:hypothetical protein